MRNPCLVPPREFGPDGVALVAGYAGPQKVSSPVLDLASWAFQASNANNTSQLLYDITGNGNSAQMGSTAGADSNDPTLLPHDGVNNYIALFRTTDNKIIANYASSYNTTDLDLVFCGSSANWDAGSKQVLLARYQSAPDRAFQFYTLSGTLTLDVYDGTNLLAQYTKAQTFTDDTIYWVRVTLDADDGASGSVATFYYSTDSPNTDEDAVSWTSLGTDTDSNITLPTVSSHFDVGHWRGNSVLDGNVYRAALRASIGGAPVAELVGDEMAHVSWTGSDGQDWSISRAASGKPAWLVDEPCVLFDGTDDYAVVADGPTELDLGTGAATLAVAMRAVDATNNDQSVLSKRDVTAPQQGYAIKLDNGTAAPKGRFDGGASHDEASGSDLTNLVRYSLIVARDGSSVTFYTDGSAGTPVTDNARDVDLATDFQVGGQDGANILFRGAIYSAAVFKTGLSASQVSALHAELTP